ETLRELGEAETIVRAHLDERMAELDERERELAAGAFQYLLTPSGTKIALAAPELADWMGEPETEVAAVLEKLTGSHYRILRSVDSGDGSQPRYEIHHDVLAKAILPWRAHHAEARRVEEVRHEEERKRERQRASFARRLAIVFAVGAVCLAGAVAWALFE